MKGYELQIEAKNIASQRVAAKAGFNLVESVEVFVQGTGDTYTDLIYARIA